MLYSALDAATLWGNGFFVLPHFIIGGLLLEATWHRKNRLRGASGPVALVLQGVVGSVFFLVAIYATVNSTFATFSCRNALRNGDASTVTGIVTIEKKHFKPGNESITFSIDGRTFKTGAGGRSCDCGYIKSVGNTIASMANTPVTAKVKDDIILSLERIQQPPTP